MPEATRYGNSDLQVRSVNRDKRTIDFIASTFAIDSYGTRIDQNGWQFSNKTPITWAHDDRGFTPSGGRPIARAINLQVVNGQLRGTAEFPKKGIFQFADEIYELAADGFIPATSVGFQPIKEEMSVENGQQVPIYRQQRLLEIAFVTIPSNDEAQIDARTRMLNREDELEKIQSRLKNLETMATELEALPEERAKTDDSDDDTDDKDSEGEDDQDDGKEDKSHDNVEDSGEKDNVEDSDEKSRYTNEYIAKCVSYFEKKQPVNKAASTVLKKFFTIRGENPPADEMEAWQRMGEQLETKAVEPEKRDDNEEEDRKDDNVEDADSHNNVEDARSVTEKPSNVSAEEAPQPARKASVQIPLPMLLAFKRSMQGAAEEALRQGIPVKDVGGFIDSLGTSLKQSVSHS